MLTDRPARRRLRGARHRPRLPAAAGLAALVLAGGASYTVQPGDTLSGIALRQKVSARELAVANGIIDPNRIVAGQKLTLPGANANTAAVASHTVARGDTLERIARRYGISQRMLADANRLTNRNLVVIGQKLSIPAAATAPAGAHPTTGATASHTVQPGDNLARIAARHGVAVRVIAEANGLRNPNIVQTGRTLQIPGSRAGQPGVVPAASLDRASARFLLEQTANRYGWSPAFVKAVAWQESGWNQRVVSRANAIGIMQVLPSTGEFVSRYLVRRPLDITQPQDNVEAGVAFLDYLHKLTGGDTEMILAGYYQGLASVQRNGRLPATDRYIANVLALRERFR
jgi:N-acetylmuramoyl-L-alanine amidase